MDHFLIILILSVLDGLQFRMLMRIIFCLIASIIYTFITIYYFLKEQDIEDEYHIANISISIKSILTQSAQILALFFWYVVRQSFSFCIYYTHYIFLRRQTILSIVGRKRCCSITIMPFIKWERNHHL